MKDATIAIRIKESDKNYLAAVANKKDIPVSQLIREMIKKYIQEEKENE